VGTTGCGGWAIILNKSGDVSVAKRCDGSVFETGYYIPAK
jgi:hypothetical protein